MKIKILTSVLLIGLLSLLVAGGTLAYFTDEAAVKKATFRFTTVEIAITEKSAIESSAIELNCSGPTSEPAAWLISNEGSEDVRLRVKVVEMDENKGKFDIQSLEPESLEQEPFSGEETGMGPDLATETDAPGAAGFRPPSPPQIDLVVISQGWTKNGDYYYYDGTLPQNGKAEFAVQLRASNDNLRGTYSKTVKIMAQALQVSNTDEDTWQYLNY